MTVIRVANKLDAMSTKLWAETIRLEKLSELASDHATACEDINLPYNDSFVERSRIVSNVARRMTEISFKLSGLEATMQEAAIEVDELVTTLEDLVPPSRRK